MTDVTGPGLLVVALLAERNRVATARASAVR
jgi:selenophosphate synthase